MELITPAELVSLIEKSIELHKQSIEMLQKQSAKELAEALRNYTSQPNKGGRPVKHEVAEDNQFFLRVEKLAEIWGYSGDRWFPSLCREAIERFGTTELRRNKARIEAQIKTLANRRSKWRARNKR